MIELALLLVGGISLLYAWAESVDRKHSLIVSTICGLAFIIVMLLRR